MIQYDDIKKELKRLCGLYVYPKDVVEVVRCKDCVHRYQITCPFVIPNAYETRGDDFCSRGERREDG